jgi:electron transport complex protein RnfB
VNSDAAPQTSAPPRVSSLADAIDAALPQTQCTRCGYPDCRAYAQAIADGAPVNQCPPGGAQGIVRLAAITGRAALPLNPANGIEGPRQLALIDEAWCIGCTLCLEACPVDCIVGGPKAMHTVIEALCTGCELCIPVCPVDCISLQALTGERTGWDAWSPAQADEARERYARHQARHARDAAEREQRLAAKARTATGPLRPAADAPAAAIDPKRSIVDAALARAHERRR